jgi:LysM repeat protein
MYRGWRMQASNGSEMSTRAPVRARASSPSGGGPERYVLGMALLLPLAVVILALAQLPGTTLASPPTLLQAESSLATMGKRPASSNPAPPPTLVPPTATPRPTATPVVVAPAQPTATPQKGGTYIVQPGDELKHIAADYNVSIWKIIAANDIPNPDSLKIGQILKIPSE